MRFRISTLALWAFLGLGATATAQNVGIGVAAPLERLHVAGGIRANTLAGVNSRLVMSDANGTLTNLAAGTANYVLTQGATAPQWSDPNGIFWRVGGNTLTAVGNLGTISNHYLPIVTANVERMRVLANGQVVVANTAALAGDIFSSYAGAGSYAVNGYGSTGVGVYGEATTGAAVQGLSAGGFGVYGADFGAGVAGVYGAVAGTAGSAGLFEGVGTGVAPTVDIYRVTGNGFGLEVENDVNSTLAGGAFITTFRGRGLEVNQEAGNTQIGVASFHNGTSRAGNFQQNNAAATDVSVFVSHAGNGRVVNAQNTLATTTQQVGFFAQSSTGTTAAYNNAAAVWGQSAGIRGGTFLAGAANVNSTGLSGQATGAAAVDHVGVFGYSAGTAGWGYGVVGQGNWYGVYAVGDLGASGIKPFMIDHPAHPETHYLRHFALESNEVLNVYRGSVQLDASGNATVTLPDYFHLVNINFSYTLTPVGAAMPNLHVSTEINTNGTFTISGGQPNGKASWYVYAERNDPYLQQNPDRREVVLTKKPEDVGTYLVPALYGQPAERGQFYDRVAQPLDNASPVEPNRTQQRERTTHIEGAAPRNVRTETAPAQGE